MSLVSIEKLRLALAAMPHLRVFYGALSISCHSFTNTYTLGSFRNRLQILSSETFDCLKLPLQRRARLHELLWQLLLYPCSQRIQLLDQTGHGFGLRFWRSPILLQAFLDAVFQKQWNASRTADIFNVGD